MTLRPYQEDALDGIAAAWRGGARAPLLCLPTGTGKTATACEAVRRAVARGKRALWLAHRRELIAQASERLRLEGVEHGVILAGHAQDPHTPVQVASVDSLRARRKPPADLVVWDEAHHAVARTWCAIGAHYPRAYHLGLSATPQRGDGRALGDCFDALVCGITVREAIAQGHLVPCDVIAPERGFDRGRQIAADPVAAYQRHAAGRRAAVYAATLEQAAQYEAAFNAAGVPARRVEGRTGADERQGALRDVAEGRILVIVNVGILTEGTDIPSLEVCVLARQVGTAGLFLQIVGRVLRPSPGKDRAMLIDLGGSVHKHGRPEAERHFSLDGKGIMLGPSPESAEVCPGCGAAKRVLAPWPCARCGYEPPSRDVEIKERPLALLGEDASYELRRHHLERLVARAIERGYAAGWLYHQYRALFGADLAGPTWREAKRRIETSSKWREARAARERDSRRDPQGARPNA